MSKSDDELKDLLPAEIYETSKGEQIEIKPVPFGKMRMFTEAVTKLAEKLNTHGLQLEKATDWRAAFDIAFEEVLNVMSIVISKPRKWFDTIDIADGLGILDIIVAQNFNDRAKKNLQSIVERVSSLLRTPSNT